MRFFLSHRHIAWVSTDYVWQEHIFPVTLLSHVNCLVTAMWQDSNLPVTHNSLIHNKYDGVTGKSQKNFFLIMMKKSSLYHTYIPFLDVRQHQFQFKSNSAPIHLQSGIGGVLDFLWPNICIAQNLSLTCLRSLASPLQIRCKSHSIPILWNGLEAD